MTSPRSWLISPWKNSYLLFRHLSSRKGLLPFKETSVQAAISSCMVFISLLCFSSSSTNLTSLSSCSEVSQWQEISTLIINKNVAFPSLLTLLHFQICSIILLLSLISIYIHRKDVLMKFKRSEHFNITLPFQPSDFSTAPATPPIPSPLWLGARPHYLANWSPFHFTSLGTPGPILEADKKYWPVLVPHLSMLSIHFSPKKAAW